jgi:NADH-quinone oxidoreductase subunit L
MDLYVKVLFLLPLIVAAAGLILGIARKVAGVKLPAVEPYLAVASAAAGLGCVLMLWSQPLDHAVSIPLYQWIAVGEFKVGIDLRIDELSRLMLTVVTFVGLLVHVFSLGYMAEDEGKSRYFSGLALFMFSMLGIVLSDNLIMMFIFWELVGVSSYLLIGHWYEKPSAADAAKKAFIVNRIGDFGFMLGILMLWAASGEITFSGLLETIGTNPDSVNPTYLWIAVAALFCGAIGKSAQVPLHVWLPDAMEGPTPVSALIHAATMVAAGVYMMSRVSFLVELAPIAGGIITAVGIVTAVLAALMALEQDDIKRILAYSTLSQLGYMIMTVGLGAPQVAMFHLTTHAFFKALLFLGSGAIIHATHHEQDIWRMGGLAKKMPITWITFTIGTLALVGCPLLAGFFSKEEILGAAYENNQLLFAGAALVAFLTAFYMSRLWVVVFWGKPRTEHAGHAHDVGLVMLVPLILLAIPSVGAGYFPKILKPHIEHAATQPTDEFVPVGAEAEVAAAAHTPAEPKDHHAEEHHPSPVVLLTSIIAFALGTVAAFALFLNKERQPYAIPGFSKLLRNRFYIDDLYAWLVRVTQDALAAFAGFLDRWIIDGLCVRGLGVLGYGVGSLVRYMQAGNLQGYSLLFAIGVIIVLIITIY